MCKVYSVRKAVPNDLSRLVQMGRLFHAVSGVHSPFDEDAFAAMLKHLVENDVSTVLALVSDNQVVGMTAGMLYPTWYCPGELTGQELFWWVDEAHRGGGKALIDELEAWARTQGAVTFSLAAMANDRLPLLTRLYRMRGYAPQETVFTKRF